MTEVLIFGRTGQISVRIIISALFLPKIHFRHHGPDPGPDPWPIIHQLAVLGPRPEPWRSFAGELNRNRCHSELRSLLETTAALVDHEGISRELAEMGGILARQ